MKKTLKQILILFFRKYSGYAVLANANTRLQEELKIWKTGFLPPGHYYSPFPDKEEIKINETTIFNKNLNEIPGVDLNTNFQLSLLNELAVQYPMIDFPVQQSKNNRYYFDNQFFSYSDAISLSTIILHFKPQRIIEVGSGYSSAVMLDINENLLNNKIELVFIEPFPEDRLNELVKKSDNYELKKEFIQNIPISFFEKLEENDILFVDSSHISKTYSDVNYILFQILPALKKGVIVHFHDIFYPFEYPKEWVYNERGWNEAYILRSFLQYNKTFSILLFTSYLEQIHKDWYQKEMPLCLKKHEYWENADGSKRLLETGGQSIYIKKQFNW